MDQLIDTSCTRTAFAWTNETSSDGCCAACAANDMCKVWEYSPGPVTAAHKGNCHLKTEAGPHESQHGTTCGSKTPFPSPPAPAPPTPLPPAAKGSPNIVMFLTDDQDRQLGGSFPEHNGVGPLPKTRELMADQGAMANNWFIHTPICCPSRSELVTGRYFHNLKTTGGGCMHIDEGRVNNQTFALYLQQAGWAVGMFGKYLNNNPKQAPPGISAYMTNGGGEYFAPQVDTVGVSDLAPYHMADGSWTGSETDYTTAIVGNTSISWVRKVAKAGHPFFAYVAPKACHEPFTPAAWYADHWAANWPATEPRPVSWNCSAESRSHHHGNIATQPMISVQCAEFVTTSFKDRWRALMSVDDVIGGVMAAVRDEGVDDRTYYFYSSDHGFQLGELNILIDKRQMYDYDVRIHLLIKGPGIAANTTFAHFGTQVDLAPTWLGIAGIDKPPGMDGRSIAPLLIDPADEAVPAPTAAHVKKMAPGGAAAYAAGWRDSVFVEYYYNSPNVKCSSYPTEDEHNNFIGIRHHPDSEFGDTSYTEYQTGNQAKGDIDFSAADFVEYFDLQKDPWQMDNKWQRGLGNATQAKLHAKLHKWFQCQGDACP